MSKLLVNRGLNVLAETSRAIRNGNGSSVPSIFRRSARAIGNAELGRVAASVEQGANAVLNEVGINPNLLRALGISTHAITSTGLNMAKSVFSNVINGDFSVSSITEAVSRPFESMHDLINNSKSIIPFNNNLLSDRPSPYATDKASFNNHPKFKFLFIAEFIFYDDFQDALVENGNNMAFLVRTASRPNVHVEYEDVNMYNFKTKIPKSTEYQPISMSFFDDQSNQTTAFYKKYLELMIPNMQMPESTIEAYEYSSFNFSDDRDVSPYNSSNLQALSGKSGHKNIIKTIRLFHIWGWGQYVNVYKFHNPKISEINISDLDMESSDLAEIQIQFTYDGLNIETTTDSGANISVDPNSPNNGGYNIPEYSIPYNRGKYPLHYNGNYNSAVKMNGSNSELPEKLKQKSLDVWNLTNPDAPDSDFKPKLKNGGSFPDFNSLLSGTIDTATNLLRNTDNVTKAINTINTAKQVFGNNIPNINNLATIFNNQTTSISNQLSNGIDKITKLFG